jgi:hypothetical protein
MTSISHERPALARTPSWVTARDMWASLAIIAIWLAVLFTALFGPDFQTADAGGGSTTIPSGDLRRAARPVCDDSCRPARLPEGRRRKLSSRSSTQAASRTVAQAPDQLLLLFLYR